MNECDNIAGGAVLVGHCGGHLVSRFGEEVTRCPNRRLAQHIYDSRPGASSVGAGGIDVHENILRECG
jgi:hypothetical protein